ncbi:MAG: hypothetical protein RL018_1712 [Pseudomonadota bacterium]
MQYTQRSVLLAKIETTYGVDPVPTGAANAILVSDLNVTPLDQDSDNRGLIRPYFGNNQNLPTANRAMVEFSVELAGSGALGTAPAYGPLLRACGLAEVITASTKVEYSPISNNFESVTAYINYDGVLHKLTGARGTVSFALDAKQIPHMKFKLTGLFNAVTDTALPTASFSAFQQPLAVLTGQTSAFSLHSYAGAPLQSLAIDLAITVVHRVLVGTEAVVITDRAPAGKAVIEANAVATKDWWTLAKNATLGALTIQHGTTAGNICQLDAPQVQIAKPAYSDQDKIRMLNMDLILCPSAGNDEFKLTVR